MSTPQHDPANGQVSEPTVSTAPTSGTAAAPPDSRWFNWGAIPDHLGRARTSTVIFSVLFLAIFLLYLNVKPDDLGGDRSPAGGGGDVDIDAPVVPGLPTQEPEPTEEPAPTTEPEPTRTPTTSPSTSSPGTTTPAPTSEPDEATETSEPAEPTGGTDGEDTSEPTSPSAP